MEKDPNGRSGTGRDTVDRDEAQIVTRWHAALQKPLNRGDRAALRRASGVGDAYAVPAFGVLYSQLGRPSDDTMVARMAIALAEVDRDTGDAGGRTGSALGRAYAQMRDRRPCMTGERLRLLATAEDPDQFLRLLRGSIDLLKREAPLRDLARIIRDWHRPDSRERARRQLFLSYFDRAPSDMDAAPADSAFPETATPEPQDA